MKSILIALLASTVTAAGTHNSEINDEFNTVNEHPDVHWTYVDNGANWPTKSKTSLSGATNECGTGVNQSPIDLKNSWPTKSSAMDRFQRVYTDQIENIKIIWNGHTSQVAVDKAHQNIQTFYSRNAGKSFGSPDRYNGVQFHFHHESEHTIEGKRFDLEMHTVHLPYDGENDKVVKINGFMAAAQGIIFSVNDASRSFKDEEVAVIDKFFDSLQWNVTTTEPLVPLVPYGELMQMVDMKGRYTYRGSVTTPPCMTSVYWNVLTTVYPLKQRHLDQFKAQLNRKKGLLKTGNWRLIQPETAGHSPVILQDRSGRVGMLVAVIILAVVVFALLVLVIKMRMTMKSMSQSAEGDKPKENTAINAELAETVDKQNQ